MPDDLVTIARFSNLAAAELARNDLEAAGIRAVYFEQNSIWSNVGVMLQIAAGDAERALAVLAKSDKYAKHSNHRGADQSLTSAVGEEPVEATEELNSREKAADRAFFMAIAGLVVPLLAIYVAWQLGIVVFRRGRLSPRMRIRAIWAAAINLVVVVLLV